MCHAWEVRNVDKVEDRTCREETMVRSGHRGGDNFKIYLGIFCIALLQYRSNKAESTISAFYIKNNYFSA
jgi:hypothetical protein